MKILVVGQNPSAKNLGATPFIGTKSGSILLDWLLGIVGKYDKVKLMNASFKLGKVTMKDLNFSELAESAADADKILALGNYASKALTKIGIKHHKMPHPSGLNRKLNDKAYVRAMVQIAKEYVNE